MAYQPFYKSFLFIVQRSAESYPQHRPKEIIAAHANWNDYTESPGI